MKSNDSAVRLTRARVAAEIPSVRVVTYNIHTCVGVDRRYDPSRISTVLREIDADIACLQEVDAHRRSERYADQWAYLGVAYEKQGNKIKAMESYNRAMEVDPQNALAREGLRRLG